jgi:peroxiredoxin
MKRRLSVAALVVMLLAAVTLLQAMEKKEAALRLKVPDFTLKDQDGKDVKLSDYAGKVVVLEWTNPECPFVKYVYKGEEPPMVQLAEKYMEKGVVWLAVNSTKHWDVEKNKRWAEKKEIPYPILDDHTGEVGKAYGAKTTPHMYIINKEGNLVYEGAIDSNPLGKKDETTNYVAAALDEVLAGKPVSTAKTKPYGCSVKYAK